MLVLAMLVVLIFSIITLLLGLYLYMTSQAFGFKTYCVKIKAFYSVLFLSRGVRNLSANSSKNPTITRIELF